MPAQSCVPEQANSTVPDGTRIDDPADGFAITLPQGWAQIDLASGEVTPAFSGVTMEPGTGAIVRAMASRAKGAGYRFLAVDLAPIPEGGQSPTPADLIVTLVPAVSATLDTIAASIINTERGRGVTGDIEQTRLTVAGIDALGIRFSDVQHDLNGQLIPTVETFYIVPVRDTAYNLLFTATTANEAAEAPIFDAMARSVEIHSSAPGCPTATP